MVAWWLCSCGLFANDCQERRDGGGEFVLVIDCHRGKEDFGIFCGGQGGLEDAAWIGIWRSRWFLLRKQIARPRAIRTSTWSWRLFVRTRA